MRVSTAAPAILALFAAALPVQAMQSTADHASRIGQRAEIPFVTDGGVRAYQPGADERTVFIQDLRRNWYQVTFFNRCLELPYAFGVGIKTLGGGPNLTRGDTIIARGERCRIADIVRSAPPADQPGGQRPGV